MTKCDIVQNVPAVRNNRNKYNVITNLGNTSISEADTRLFHFVIKLEQFYTTELQHVSNCSHCFRLFKLTVKSYKITNNIGKLRLKAFIIHDL